MKYRHEPAIGLLEFSSIALGIDALDRLLKEASVRALFARPVSPGKYIALFTGDVEDVTSSLRVGAGVGGDAIVDRLLIPSVAPQVLEALDRPTRCGEIDALGVVETTTVAAAIRAADVAAKRAAIRLIELHLAQGIGGKSYFTLTGPIDEVESAVTAAAALAESESRLVARTVIARVHPDLRAALESHERPI